MQINLLEFFLVTKPPLNFRAEMLSPFAVSYEHACTHANKEKQFVRKKIASLEITFTRRHIHNPCFRDRLRENFLRNESYYITGC